MTKRTSSDLTDKKANMSNDIKMDRKPYEPPRILSIEPLEAVAAACEPVGPAPFGKDLECVQSQS